MATTVHLPPELLAQVDQRAKRLRLNRNQFVQQALRNELARELGWSEQFFAQMGETSSDIDEASDEMLRAILVARSSKPAPQL